MLCHEMSFTLGVIGDDIGPMHRQIPMDSLERKEGRMREMCERVREETIGTVQTCRGCVDQRKWHIVRSTYLVGE